MINAKNVFRKIFYNKTNGAQSFHAFCFKTHQHRVNGKKGNNKCNHPIDDDHGGSRPQTVIQIHGEGMEMTCGLHEIHNMLVDLEDSNDTYVKDYTRR